MITLREANRLRLVTQNDHAAFAAELLSLCRLPELASNPRRDGLLRAVRLHDNGWREPDAAPRVDADSGLPYTFLDLPQHLRLDVWDRGTSRHADSDPYVALLATEHALTLYRVNADQTGWRELLPRLAERRDELLARCALTADELAADYAFLALADRLSLMVCSDWQEPVSCHGFTARWGEEGLTLFPFPLAGATSFAVACRWIEARRYASDTDLTIALASAPWESFAVRVTPPRG